MTLNSSKLIIPSPSLSTPPIIFRHSSIEHSSPKLRSTSYNSSAEIDPFPSMSASAESTPLVLSSTNSLKLMKPSPSESTSEIMLLSSSSEDGCPRLLMMAPSSEDEIFPSPLTSNFLKTWSSSAIWAREWKEGVREWAEAGAGWAEAEAVGWAAEAASGWAAAGSRLDFFFREKRDLKPIWIRKNNRKPKPMEGTKLEIQIWGC
ncbi:calcium-binding protein CML25 [Pyrus ussuriensis x Pyrus communis]|uniref:Calcium-binding protein CML25 n=1 Tax=Pyrus ussuriensis x Pyrus communis TaxID=2448454 RepID=A0A5N5HC47_9ROSA|nr:calcium-binding protein CML25 [Pyrus ussuriensis x Pyrus communis]